MITASMSHPDRSLYLRWHLGLGDALICNGLVRTLAPRYWHVYLPAKPHNVAAIRAMFSDLPHVVVLPIADDTDCDRLTASFVRNIDVHVVGLGNYAARPACSGGTWDVAHWDDAFYVQAGLSPELRWSAFAIGGLRTIWPDYRDSGHIFLHDDPERGYIARLYHYDGCTIRPRPDRPFWDWRAPLEYAREIHCIDSCFLHLADLVPCAASRYVWHKYARPPGPNSNPPSRLRKPWEVLA